MGISGKPQHGSRDRPSANATADHHLSRPKKDSLGPGAVGISTARQQASPGRPGVYLLALLMPSFNTFGQQHGIAPRPANYAALRIPSGAYGVGVGIREYERRYSPCHTASVAGMQSVSTITSEPSIGRPMSMVHSSLSRKRQKLGFFNCPRHIHPCFSSFFSRTKAPPYSVSIGSSCLNRRFHDSLLPLPCMELWCLSDG
jgi:hypothetical protein